MAEDASSGEAEPIGLSVEDIKPDVYEGGFKTWECSIDLARYLASNRGGLPEPPSDRHFVAIEVCGKYLFSSNTGG